MKKITETIGKVFTVVAFAAVLVGTTFALPLRNEAGNKSKKFDQKAMTQVFEKVEKQMSLNNVKKIKQSEVAEANKLNFVTGHYLMRVLYDYYQFNDIEGVLYDLEMLSILLEGKPEQAEIVKLYEAIVAEKLEEGQLDDMLFDIEESYAASLTEEQNWFLRYGEWTTCLMADAFGDEDGIRADELIAEDLYMLESMAIYAPEGDAKKVIEPVGALSRFIEATTYTDEDYEEMRSVAFNIFDLTVGE